MPNNNFFTTIIVLECKCNWKQVNESVNNKKAAKTFGLT